MSGAEKRTLEEVRQIIRETASAWFKGELSERKLDGFTEHVMGGIGDEGLEVMRTVPREAVEMAIRDALSVVALERLGRVKIGNC